MSGDCASRILWYNAGECRGWNFLVLYLKIGSQSETTSLVVFCRLFGRRHELTKPVVEFIWIDDTKNYAGVACVHYYKQHMGVWTFKLNTCPVSQTAT